MPQDYGYRCGILANAFQEAVRNTTDSRQYNHTLHRRGKARDLCPADPAVYLPRDMPHYIDDGKNSILLNQSVGGSPHKTDTGMAPVDTVLHGRIHLNRDREIFGGLQWKKTICL